MPRVRLSNPVYESLPALYLLAGAALLYGSYRLHSGALSVLLLIAGVISVIAGAVVWLRRRDFRAVNAEYWSNRNASSDDDDLLR
jgi:hypothetical protein